MVTTLKGILNIPITPSVKKIGKTFGIMLMMVSGIFLQTKYIITKIDAKDKIKGIVTRMTATRTSLYLARTKAVHESTILSKKFFHIAVLLIKLLYNTAC